MFLIFHKSKPQRGDISRIGQRPMLRFVIIPRPLRTLPPPNSPNGYIYTKPL